MVPKIDLEGRAYAIVTEEASLTTVVDSLRRKTLNTFGRSAPLYAHHISILHRMQLETRRKLLLRRLVAARGAYYQTRHGGTEDDQRAGADADARVRMLSNRSSIMHSKLNLQRQSQAERDEEKGFVYDPLADDLGRSFFEEHKSISRA
jgi:hypothetical protein